MVHLICSPLWVRSSHLILSCFELWYTNLLFFFLIWIKTAILKTAIYANEIGKKKSKSYFQKWEYKTELSANLERGSFLCCIKNKEKHSNCIVSFKKPRLKEIGQQTVWQQQQ